MAARHELENAALTLENDHGFYTAYTATPDSCTKERETIRMHLWHMREFIPGDFRKEDRETLRRYFNDRYGRITLPDSTKPSYNLLEPKPQEAQKPTAKAAINYRTETVFYSLPEHPAMSQNLNLTTKHYLNGQDIETLSNAQLFDAIAKQEAAIESLQAIKKKPASLQREIKERQESIDKLVAFLDERDSKRQ